MLVIDASAVVELLLGRHGADAVARQIRDHGYELHAPHLLDVEVLSALRRVVAGGDASVERAADAVGDLLALPLERHAHDILAPRIWALRPNLSAYDAAYVALAEVVTEAGVPLLTADERLARAAGVHSGIRVLVAS